MTSSAHTPLRGWPTGVFALLLLPVCLLARPEFGTVFRTNKLAEIDAAIELAMEEKRMPGAVIWLERHGLAYHRAYGRRAVVPKSEPMTEETVFDLASLTKVVATTPSIMLLVERGQLELNGRVRNYIPEFIRDGKDEITIRQLLTHTSGLRAGLGRKVEGPNSAIYFACQEKTNSVPGTAFRYSDINFILLGEVVQRVAHTPLHVFAEDEIFGPLKMRDTGFLPAEKLRKRIAPTEGTLRGIVHDPTARGMGGVAGHAGLFSTAADLARFARMMVNLGELDGLRLFKADTVRLMTAVQTPPLMESRRGLGWDIDTGYSRRGSLYPIGSYGHTGFTGPSIWIDPFSKSFVIFLSNRVHPDARGDVRALQRTLGTLAAEAIIDFDFSNVPGALAARTNVPTTNALQTASNAAPVRTTAVLNGIDVLVRQNFAPLRNLRVGLITNHTGHDNARRPTIDLLMAASNVTLKALFSPEHGIRGELDEKVTDGVDSRTGLPIYSLYDESRSPTPEELAGLDALVFDIQDIGCRFYTYISTMGLCLEAAAQAGLKFFVLDRVNPINGTAVEGPVFQGASMFTAFHSIPLRHGMTVGELARLFNIEGSFNADLTVVALGGWKRDQWLDETGLPWTNPSPNMRNLTQAILYPGVGLLESAISVGRGTDTPFEVVGAPYIDDVQLAAELNAAGLAGVRFVPIRFTPNSSVFTGQPCGGVYLLVTDRAHCPVVDVGLTLALTLQRLYPSRFAIDKMHKLLQDGATLNAIRAGRPLAEIKQGWQTELEGFKQRRQSALLYRD